MVFIIKNICYNKDGDHMEFIKEIKILENTLIRKEDVLTTLGTTNVLLTALDTLDINNPDGSVILAPVYLKAIARYVAAYTNSSYFVRLHEKASSFQELSTFITTNNIALVLDINSAKTNQENIKITPLTNTDKTLLNEIYDAFKEQNISSIEINEIPKTTSNLDIIKIELPKKYRDLNQPELIQNVCQALINFIKMYINIAD